MKTSGWIALAVIALVVSGHLPERPFPIDSPALEAPRNVQEINVSGQYAIHYSSIYGHLDVCVQHNHKKMCAPVSAEFPLYQGQVAAETSLPVGLAVKRRVRHLLGKFGDALDFQTVIMRSEQNSILRGMLHNVLTDLPKAIELRHVPGESNVVAFVQSRNKLNLVPGDIQVTNGRFEFHGIKMTGRLFKTHHKAGRGEVIAPVHVNVFDEMPGTARGDAAISLTGELVAELELINTQAPRPSRPTLTSSL